MTYYLLDNPNPNAPGGFWGYRGRREPVRLLVVHTSESPFDTSGGDSGAENVARYLSNVDRAASYHAIGDSDSFLPLLPYTYTAFGARGHNSHAVHLAFAGVAADWPKLSDAQVAARLSVLAREAREVCTRFGIPVRRLVDEDARADGAHGICGHADLDPSRRSDPGARFPWGRFLELISNDESDDDMPVLVRHGDRPAVYQVVGKWLYPLADPKVAEILAGDGWLGKVRSLSDAEFRLFTVTSGDLPSAGGAHTHPEYASKSHGHSGRVTLD